jgi:hypothetical protein
LHKLGVLVWKYIPSGNLVHKIDHWQCIFSGQVVEPRLAKKQSETCRDHRNQSETCRDHRNLRSRSGMHLCNQDDQNGQKAMVLTSAEETRLTCFILSQNIFSVVNNLVWQLMLTPLWTWTLGVMCPLGECSPLHSPPGVTAFYCLEEWRVKQRISPPGDRIHPRGQSLPLEWTSGYFPT